MNTVHMVVHLAALVHFNKKVELNKYSLFTLVSA